MSENNVEQGENKLEHDAEAISDVAPNARLHLSKYAKGRYAIVNFRGLHFGEFDDEPSGESGARPHEDGGAEA